MPLHHQNESKDADPEEHKFGEGQWRLPHHEENGAPGDVENAVDGKGHQKKPPLLMAVAVALLLLVAVLGHVSNGAACGCATGS